MKRAVIYARCSTDLQDERSIDDQISLCRDFAKDHGFTVAKTFHDKARSGASTINRDGLRRMMDAAKEAQFEIVVVEALDRLSRDMADIYKRLQYYRIEICAVHEGRVDTVLIGLRGLVSQLYREDNVKKMRRGLAGRVHEGLHAGGRPYGYHVDPQAKGKWLIVEEEAEIVRRIFAEFAYGKSPRSIAQRLNEAMVPPPRGRNWNASTINGNADRGNGILRNELYRGRVIWNKVRMIRNPDTGLRVSRANPSEQWQITEVTEYRIVDEELFQSVAERLQARKYARPEHQRRAKQLLSGLLRCGVCGSGVSTCGKDKSGRVRIRCSAARESGTCPDPKTFYLDIIENAVLEAVLNELSSPQAITAFVETYTSERKRLAADAARNRMRLSRRISETSTEIE